MYTLILQNYVALNKPMGFVHIGRFCVQVQWAWMFEGVCLSWWGGLASIIIVRKKEKRSYIGFQLYKNFLSIQIN